MIYDKFFITGFLLIILLLNSCAFSESESQSDLYIKLEKEIMCPVCDGQTLDQSQSLIAENMKDTIKKKIEEGYDEKEIKNYFISRYGESVIAYPTFQGFNIVAYLIPVLLIILGLVVLGFYIKKDKKISE
mgnify:FL=1